MTIAERDTAQVNARLSRCAARRPGPIRLAFIMHAMPVAGAEMLVAELVRRLRGQVEASIFCLDSVGALGEQLSRESIEVLALGRQPGLDLGVARRLAALLCAHDIEVVHAHQYTPFFYAALAKLLGWRRAWPRLILTEHGRHYPDVVSTRRRAGNRLVLDRLADAVNAVCHFSAERLCSVDGFAGARIAVIPNGIEVARYATIAPRAELRRRLGFDPARRYVVHVARCHPVKDQETLLRGFALACAGRPDVELLFAGDGPLRAELEALAARLDLKGRVRFLGVRHDVPELLQAADVFALTSLSEAASLTLLEAMASRLPVVVTAVGGNPELVRHEVEGLLVPRRQPVELGAALGRVLDDPELGRQLGRAGAARVQAHYRLEQTVARYHDLYRRLAHRD